jgi:hypothetical protein
MDLDAKKYTKFVSHPLTKTVSASLFVNSRSMFRAGIAARFGNILRAIEGRD